MKNTGSSPRKRRLALAFLAAASLTAACGPASPGSAPPSSLPVSTPGDTSSEGEGYVNISLGEAQDSQPGLYVENGVVLLAGRPFYGIGTNYYDAAFRHVTAPMDGDIEPGIANVASYEYPYIRARFSSWGGEGMYFFWEDRKTFFAGMDRMVALCEEYQIGIIASLVWTPLPYMTEGQTWGDFLGNPDAEGYRQMLEYIEAVVTRYKHSPAIWGWEVGNEFNLACDVDNHQLGAQMLAEFYQDVTARIREWDGTGRIIATGNSQNRHASRHLMDGQGWTPDSEEDMRFMLELYDTPQMSVTSTHVYNREQHVGSRSGTIEEYLRLLTGFCRDMGKPLFVGEYCDDEERLSEEDSLAKFQALHDAILANDIQLAVQWIHSRTEDAVAYPDSYWRYMMEQAKEANRGFVAGGKQDTASYWSRMRPVAGQA